jgi:dTDP-4-amino-4,6-dideoxygalactose transaminase
MIYLFKVFMGPETGDYVKHALYSGYIAQGPKVDQFEHKLSYFLQDLKLEHSPYVNTVNSCTSALQLATYLAGATNGDLIISTPMTCSATNTAIKAMGGQIIWADIDPKTGNIDPQSVNRLLERYPKIRAVVAVHWAGYPCDLSALNDMGDHYGVKIIEDAAHAFGATYRGSYIGNHSNFICFSFQAIKHLTTVDGGALICKDLEDHKRAKLLRWFGIDREAPREDNRIEQDIEEAGWKYHMNDVNATIGIHNLDYMDFVIGRHKENGQYFDEKLQGIPGVTLLERKDDRESSYWIYTLLVENRERFKKLMAEAGIMTSQVHSRLDKYTAFQDALNGDHLPGLDEFSKKQISIPCHWDVSDEDREYIVETIQEIRGN